jgi:hypothetical protein
MHLRRAVLKINNMKNLNFKTKIKLREKVSQVYINIAHKMFQTIDKKSAFKMGVDQICLGFIRNPKSEVLVNDDIIELSNFNQFQEKNVSVILEK